MTDAAQLFGPEHVARYLETDGEVGYRWHNDTTILLLFTKGRNRVNEAAYRRPDGIGVVPAALLGP